MGRLWTSSSERDPDPRAFAPSLVGVLRMALTQTRLTALMSRTHGHASVRIGFVDGPVDLGHPELARESLHPLTASASCADLTSPACVHGTFVAGILSARRASGAPGICPGCTLLVRSVLEDGNRAGPMPSATPTAVAQAIVDCLLAGARVINLSLGVVFRTTVREVTLEEALDFAVSRGALVVASAIIMRATAP